MTSGQFGAMPPLKQLTILVLWASKTTVTCGSWTDKLDHGSVKGFPSYDEANALLEDFLRANPNELEKRQIGTSFEKRPMHAYILAMRSGRQRKPQVLLTSLMHAREPAGLTVLLYFLGHLLDKYHNNDPDAVYVLNSREIWFVPFVNPDGYVANKGLANKVIRKNRRPTCRSSVDSGVDINRNFAVKWSGSFGGCNEEHGGTQPFSEPETQAFKAICEENEFKTAMNFHAYGSMLTHPFNWARQDLMNVEDKKVYREIAQVFGYKKFGPAIKTVGYTTAGESDDWMYSARHIISMSPEVGPESGGFWPPSATIAAIDARNFDRTMYVVLKAGMELQVEWALQSSSARPTGVNLPDLSANSLKLRIWNRGLTSSYGKVLRIAVHGVASGSAGDAAVLLAEDGSQTSVLTLADGMLTWEVPPIPSRSQRDYSIYLTRSLEPAGPRSLLTCVAEVDTAPSACHCTRSLDLAGLVPSSSRSDRESFVIPRLAATPGDIPGSVCRAAAGLAGDLTPQSQLAGQAQSPSQVPVSTSEAAIQSTRWSPALRTAATTESPSTATRTRPVQVSLGLAGLAEKPDALKPGPSQGLSPGASQDALSATWILLALFVTMLAMCMCIAVQPLIVHRRVAKRGPSAVDYEQIPGLQASRREEDSDDLGYSAKA